MFILSFAIAFTINFIPMYAFDVDYFNIPERVGLSKEVILYNYRILIDYLNFPWIERLAMPDFPSSESGLFHFYEVKILFLLDYAILFISGIASFLFWQYKKKTATLYELIQPTRIMVLLPLGVLFLIFLNFDELFTTFHHIFFNNDAWLFDYRTDPIILALPQEFFMHCFILVFVILEIGLWLVHRRTEKSLG
ncbi:TIGR01906 family membrane protein [Jeotgalibaca sp. A122]|uniref:TIGR01906 family membrane protein n=1 Tax=Jeotgalibaca sp. A122 TaxID=3457322 RepID=UPI003FCF14B5